MKLENSIEKQLKRNLTCGMQRASLTRACDPKGIITRASSKARCPLSMARPPALLPSSPSCSIFPFLILCARRVPDPAPHEALALGVRRVLRVADGRPRDWVAGTCFVRSIRTAIDLGRPIVTPLSTGLCSPVVAAGRDAGLPARTAELDRDGMRGDGAELGSRI